jgi:hypothetical protein
MKQYNNKKIFFLLTFILLLQLYGCPVYSDAGINKPSEKIKIESKSNIRFSDKENKAKDINIAPSKQLKENEGMLINTVKYIASSVLLVLFLYILSKLLKSFFKKKTFNTEVTPENALNTIQKESSDISEAVSSFIKHKFHK